MNIYILYPLLILVFSFTSINETQAQRKNPDKKFKTERLAEVPAFSFTTMDGEAYNIEDLKGKTIWINFFATWCGPCVREIPHLVGLSNELEGEDDFVILYIGRSHTEAQLEPFSKRHKMEKSSIVADPDRNIYHLFADKYIPRNVIIDKEGKILRQFTGYDPQHFSRLMDEFKRLVLEEENAEEEIKKE